MAETPSPLSCGLGQAEKIPGAVENSAPPIWLGVVWALLTVTIWAGWMVVTRLGVTTGLSALDITAMRFTVAGVVLFGVFVRSLLAFRSVSPVALALMILGGGAPYVLVATTGMKFAPASHAASLIPGVMPLFVALLAVGLLGERLSPLRWGGLGLIACGASLFLLKSAAPEESHVLFGPELGGHMLFLCASFMWAVFTVTIKHTGLGPAPATALVGVGSMGLILPIYLTLGTPSHLLTLGLPALFQLFYQGVMTSVVSLITFARAVRILGAPQAAAFASLVPVMATLLAIPVLGEWPEMTDWAGMVLVSGGVYLASSPQRSREAGPIAHGGKAP